ncbi:hypothetical protein B7494_g8575 [Chlorociboria aeruginascens]|nr:hypothetical protein B7494_g8575 [Chlorociboria aeruginascens]
MADTTNNERMSATSSIPSPSPALQSLPAAHIAIHSHGNFAEPAVDPSPPDYPDLQPTMVPRDYTAVISHRINNPELELKCADGVICLFLTILLVGILLLVSWLATKYKLKMI